MTRLAVMQGRLLPPTAGRFQSFPVGDWAAEFGLAAKAGLDCLEWIYDEFGASDNPIATDAGTDSILALGAQHHVGVVSLCADYFMDRPLLRSTQAELEERFSQLEWLLRRARRLGVERVVLPFVDASAIGSADELLEAAELLAQAAAVAGEIGVELHLETSLPPTPFAELLAVLPPDVVKVTYDIGNSASLGYNPREEFDAYGERVGSVHLKDRVRGGGTVPLGEGDADFDAVFDALLRCGYRGDFVMQIARGERGGEVAWIAANRLRIEQWIAPFRSAAL